MTPEPVEVTLGRMDERLSAVERDIRDIKNTMTASRPHWTAVLSAVVALAALVVTLAINL